MLTQVSQPDRRPKSTEVAANLMLLRLSTQDSRESIGLHWTCYIEPNASMPLSESRFDRSRPFETVADYNVDPPALGALKSLPSILCGEMER